MNFQKKSQRSRNWAFTDFTLLDMNAIYTEYPDIIRYLCWGKEICPKTNREHFQGWVQFLNPKRLMGVKKIFGCNKIHVEPMRACEETNNQYCTKSGNLQKRGCFVVQGQRTDLEKIKLAIEENVPEIEIAADNFETWVRFRGSFLKYRELVAEQESTEFRHVEVQVYMGNTGTGKTRAAMEEKSVYKIQGDEMQWWDGYQGEDTLVIDEYANQIKCTKLLGILDGYQLRLPIKGGFTYAAWHKVIITTNLEVLHEQANDRHRDALHRRITEYWEFGEDSKHIAYPN